jgi:hypothetical protein
VNAAYARYLEVRRLLLIGRIDEAERYLDGHETSWRPFVAAEAGGWLERASHLLEHVAQARGDVGLLEQGAFPEGEQGR